MNSVSMSQVSTSGNIVALAVNVTEMPDVHSAAFDLAFDSTAVEYTGHGPGSLLEQGGNVPTYQVSVQAGRIVVGVARSGNTPSGTGSTEVLIELTFRVMGAGSFPLEFQNMQLLDSAQTPIGGIDWSAGAVEGV